MRKVILTVVLVLVASVSFSQWQENYFVDEFGDKTTDKYYSIFTEKGSFSNSATQNSKLFAKIVDNRAKEMLYINVYEYGKRV